MKDIKFAYYGYALLAIIIAVISGFLFTNGNNESQDSAKVDIIEGSVSLDIDDNSQLTFEILGLEDSNSVWASSDNTVATVSESGLITAVSEGVVVITLTNGDFSDYLIVTVNGVSFTASIDITEQSVALDVDATYLLSKTQNVLDETLSTWSSSDETVATVSNTGLVTALAPGIAVITLENGTTYDYVAITVSEVVLTYSVDIDEESKTLNILDTYQLNTTLDVPNGSVSVWSSSDETVAQVSNTGLVTAVSDGLAIITLTVDEATDFVVIQVLPDVITYAVDITETNQSLDVTDTYQLNTTLNVPVGSEAVWTSSDETVATVSSTGLITAVSEGTAVITLTIGDSVDYVLVEVLAEPLVNVVFIDMLNHTNEVYTYAPDDLLVYPADPTFTGYTFEGWVTNPNQLNTEVAEGTAVTDTLFLYAYYTNEQLFTVVFNTNGGDATLQSYQGNIGDQITLESPGDRNGYEFSQWRYNYRVNASLQLIYDTASVGDTITVTGNMVFFASYTYLVDIEAYNFSLSNTDYGNEYGYVIDGMNDPEAFFEYMNGSQLLSIELPQTYDGLPVLGVEYLFNEDMYYFDQVIIPEGYVFIGEEAFLGTSMNLLSIPSTVYSIIDYAFQESYIGSIEFAEDSQLLMIGSESFYQVSGLTEINIPKSVQSIDYGAFSYSSIRTVTFEEGSNLFAIWDDAFAQSQLSSIALPSKLKVIGESAFYDSELRTITIPQSVNVIGYGAFYNSTLTEFNLSGNEFEYLGGEIINSENFTFIDNLLIVDDVLIAYDKNVTSADVVIPEGVKYISGESFSFAYINTLTLPSTLEMVGRSAFLSAVFESRFDLVLPSNLKFIEDYSFQSTHFTTGSTITVGSNVEKIGNNAFSSLTGVSEITFEDNTNDPFRYNGNNTSYIIYGSEIQTVSIGEGYTVLPYRFMFASQVEVINLPSTIKTVNSGSLNSINLTSINASGTLQIENFYSGSSTYDKVFNASSPYYTNLSPVDGYYTFFNVLYDYSLSFTDFVLPQGVDYVSDYAVLNTQNSYDLSNARYIAYYAFNNVPVGQVITVNSQTGIEYRSFGVTYTDVILQFSDNIFATPLVYADVDGNYIYNNDTYYTIQNYLLKNTITPDSNGFHIVGNSIVGYTAPAGFDGNVAIPEGIVYIHDAAFYQKAITSVQFPSTLVSIGTNAFYGNNITSVTFNEGLTFLGNQSFAYNRIANIHFSSTITYISQNVFRGNQLTDITLPDTLRVIDSNSFSENVNLTNVTFEDASTLVYISDPFDNYDGSSQFYIVGGILLYIDLYDAYDFQGTLVVPEGVTVITQYAFRGDSYVEIVLPSTLVNIQENAFEDVWVNQLTFNSNPVIHENAFEWAYVVNMTNIPTGFTIDDFRDQLYWY